MRKMYAILTMIVLSLVAIAPTKAYAGCSLPGGFWIDHQEAWPEGFTPDSKLCGISFSEILQTPSKGRPWHALAHQWIIAQLNVANGASSKSLGTALDDAEDLLNKADFSQKPKNVYAYAALAGILADHNNGILSHCKRCPHDITLVCPPCPACCCPESPPCPPCPACECGDVICNCPQLPACCGNCESRIICSSSSSSCRSCSHHHRKRHKHHRQHKHHDAAKKKTRVAIKARATLLPRKPAPSLAQAKRPNTGKKTVLVKKTSPTKKPSQAQKQVRRSPVHKKPVVKRGQAAKKPAAVKKSPGNKKTPQSDQIKKGPRA